jgi:nucleoid-associated protein
VTKDIKEEAGMRVVQSVIHGFEKEQHMPVGQVIKRDTVLDPALESVATLVTGIAKLMGQRTISQNWGHFNTANRGGVFPLSFADSVAELSQPQSFLGLTHIAIDELVGQANERGFSTGGLILFAIYEGDDSTLRLLIAMIKQRMGITLDQNYVPVGVTEVDMTKLHQAAQINISKYIDVAAKHDIQAGVDDGDDDEDDSNYLSFLSTRDNNAAGYFIDALGCEVGISSAKATTHVFRAVEKFFDSNQELKQYRRTAKEKLTDYLKEKLEKSEPASITDLCHVLTTLVSAADAPHMDSLAEFLNGEKYKIPTEFYIHPTTFGRHYRVSLEPDGISLKFDRSLLGIEDNAAIVYKKEERSLTINNLSESIMQKLDKEIAQS